MIKLGDYTKYGWVTWVDNISDNVPDPLCKVSLIEGIIMRVSMLESISPPEIIKKPDMKSDLEYVGEAIRLSKDKWLSKKPKWYQLKLNWMIKSMCYAILSNVLARAAHLKAGGDGGKNIDQR